MFNLLKSLLSGLVRKINFLSFDDINLEVDITEEEIYEELTSSNWIFNQYISRRIQTTQLFNRIRNLLFAKSKTGIYNGIGENYLAKNRPDPFYYETQISFFIIKNYNTKLFITDTRGNIVKTLFEGRLRKGDYSFTWDGKNQRAKKVLPGNYNYKLILEPDSLLLVRKMTLVE